MDKEKELNELIALYAMRTCMNNYQDRGEELLRLFLKEYEQVKSVDLADVVGQSEQLPERLCKNNPNFKCNCIDQDKCPNFPPY